MGREIESSFVLFLELEETNKQKKSEAQKVSLSKYGYKNIF